jgi:uncharacterized protein YbaR (Trm112 family)
MELHSELIKLLVCPISGGKLSYDYLNQRLICLESGLYYEVKDGIPVLLKEKAKALPKEELESLRILINL